MPTRVRIRFIGDRSRLAPELVERMNSAETRTAHHRRLDLVIAVAYGGRWDIAQAARRLALDVAAGRRDAAGIDEATVARLPRDRRAAGAGPLHPHRR